MAGYLIAEEGTLTGLLISFEEGEEWILGRDPDVASQMLEDSMVSRKHAICHLTTEGYLLENLSAVNPATQNGKVISEPVLLKEGDIIQIGNTFFRFTEIPPISEEAQIEEEPSFEQPEGLSEAHIEKTFMERWLLKVISGPNTGAEFYMEKGKTYIVGKDQATSDIVFYDLSVSRQHARLIVTEEELVFIEDMASRNGVIINGELISDRRELQSQDLVALGTTSFILIDQEQVRETIYSPSQVFKEPEKTHHETPIEAPVEKAPLKDWKDMLIPYSHLVVAGSSLVVLFALFIATLSLFKTEKIEAPVKNTDLQIKEALAKYPDIQFSYNDASGKLFLVGHVLTPIQKMEVEYLLKSFTFINSVEDNIVVDEYVWQSMNSLLAANPQWSGISIHSPTPGKFILSGYLQTIEQAQGLSDYINVNFPYLDRLDNQVVVESSLTSQVQSMLIEQGFSTITFQIANGELVLSGRVDGKDFSSFQQTLSQLKKLKGIRVVRNFVIPVTGDTARIDLSDRYQIGGSSKQDDKKMFVVINGKILTEGNFLDGMLITGIEPNMILLEKDGLKFKINYNLQ